MVDFQSRDTRRGSPTEDDAEDEQTESNHTTDEVGDDGHEETSRNTESSPEKFGILLVTIGQRDEADVASEVVSGALEDDGWTVVDHEHVTAGYDAVQSAIDRASRRRAVEAVLTVGGTGVSSTDVTVEAVEPLFEKPLPGFGELFRVGYHEHVGASVIGMRLTAGISDGVPVFCLPSDAESARFAVEIVTGALEELLVELAE